MPAGTGESMKKYLYMLLLFAVMLWGCNKENPKTEPEDWSNRFSGSELPEGTSPASDVTPSVSVNTPTKKPGYQRPTKAPIPTVVPVPEFVPQEGQVELLLLTERRAGYMFDGQLLDTLNRYLQEKGYNFYLTARFSDYYKVKPDSVEEADAMEKRKVWDDIEEGIKPDLLFVYNTADEAFGDFIPDFYKAVAEKQIVPFAEYPKTEAAESFQSALPAEYRKFSSFGGECYGWKEYRDELIACIYFDLDAVEKIGMEIPEKLDFLNLDSLLQTASEQGIVPLDITDADNLGGFERLNSGLFLKTKEDGSHCFMNPLEDEETVKLLEALYRYKANGWIDWPGFGEKALINFGSYAISDFDGEVLREENLAEPGKIDEFRIKVYQKLPKYVNEAELSGILALASASEHKEEAVELLNLMFTDGEVIKILRYGCEGFHYIIGEHGPEQFEAKAEKSKQEPVYFINAGATIRNIPDGMALGNTYMRLPEEEEWGRPDYEAWLPELTANTIVSPLVEEFTEEQIEKLGEIQKLTEGVWRNGNKPEACGRVLHLISENYEEDLAKARAELRAAGYNELIAGLNQKYGFTAE